MEKGRALPDWYLDAPEPTVFDQFYMEAFSELSTERYIEGGRIPVSKIKEYARQELSMDEELVYLFTTILREMDLVYLKLIADQREKMRKDNKPPPPKPARQTRTRSTRN